MKLLTIFVSAILASAPPANARIFNALVSQFLSITGSQEEVKPTEIRSMQRYEERTYPQRNWSCIEHRNAFTEDEKDKTFLQLFDYISGENDKNLRMPMTVPVSVQYSIMDNGEKVYHACIAIKEAHQSNPPTPTNSAIAIMLRPEIKVFSRRFGGYADSTSEWLAEVEKLKQDLRGKNFRNDTMFWNAYNSPIEFWNRRNEVWLVKNQQQIGRLI